MDSTVSPMDRRRFLSLGTAGTVGLMHGAGNAGAQSQTTAPAALQAPLARVVLAPAQEAAQDIPYGASKLGLSDDGRDGMLYVPKSYQDSVAMPLLISLHGFGGWADTAKSTYALAEQFGIVVIVPESRDVTWGRSAPGFDADVKYIGAAYRQVARMFALDPDRVALAGRSDGAGYALSMGLAYGNIFNHLLVFAGGLMIPFRKQGKPKIFIAHGTNDQQMPIEQTGRKFARELKAEGYDVTYREYDGGHGTPLAVVKEGYAWFVGRTL